MENISKASNVAKRENLDERKRLNGQDLQHKKIIVEDTVSESLVTESRLGVKSRRPVLVCSTYYFVGRMPPTERQAEKKNS